MIDLRFEAGVDGLHPRRPTPWLLLAAAALLLVGCEQQSRTVLTGHPVRGRDVAQLTFGRSTTDDVLRVLGPPDERAADGSLVYRATAVRQSKRRIAGVTLGGEEEVVGQRTATFRFTGGVLQKVCRERS